MAEVVDSSLDPEEVLEAVAELEAAEVEEVERPLLAFLSPQVTDKQPVWPSRSSGWLRTQLVRHCSQTKDGMVWSYDEILGVLPFVQVQV